MPDLGGNLSCLIDVMRTRLMQQVTEKPAGTHWWRANITIAATDWKQHQILLSAVTHSSTQWLTPGWIHFRSSEFKSHAVNCWLLLENWPALWQCVCCLWARRSWFERERRCSCCEKKGSLKVSEVPPRKRIILFILLPFLIWHTFCHSFFSLHLYSSSSFHLFCSLLLSSPLWKI